MLLNTQARARSRLPRLCSRPRSRARRRRREAPPAKPAPCTDMLVDRSGGRRRHRARARELPAPGRRPRRRRRTTWTSRASSSNTTTTTPASSSPRRTSRSPTSTRRSRRRCATKRISYTFDFDLVDGITLVRAINDNGTWKFFAAKPTTLVPSRCRSSRHARGEQWVDVELKGKVYEGKNGVIEIELPAAISKPGLKLKNIYSQVIDALQGGELRRLRQRRGARRRPDGAVRAQLHDRRELRRARRRST